MLPPPPRKLQPQWTLYWVRRGRSTSKHISRRWKAILLASRLQSIEVSFIEEHFIIFKLRVKLSCNDALILKNVLSLRSPSHCTHSATMIPSSPFHTLLSRLRQSCSGCCGPGVVNNMIRDAGADSVRPKAPDLEMRISSACLSSARASSAADGHGFALLPRRSTVITNIFCARLFSEHK